MQTFVRKCLGHVACTCTVSIRSGNDVIIIDSCGERAKANGGSMQLEVYLNGQFTPGTKILQYNDGRKYKVIVLYHEKYFKG